MIQKKEAKDEYNFSQEDELWMIIDKDRWKNIPDIIELCNKQGNMFVAVSNPCFEFWILLHVKNVKDIKEQEIQDLITNSKVTNKRRYIDVYLGKLLECGYNKQIQDQKDILIN